MTDRRNCNPCSQELNQYESDIYTTIIDFLESITCIPWIRSFSEAGHPFDIKSVNTNQQYGTVYIQSIDDQETSLEDVIKVGEVERCRRVKIRSLISVNLNVINYSNINSQIIKSPSDVLSNVKTLYQTLVETYNNLCLNGINIHNFGTISNIEAMDKQDKYRAQQNLTFEVERYTSIAETLLNKIKISFNCC